MAWDGTQPTASMSVLFNQTSATTYNTGNAILVGLGSSGEPESFEDYQLHSIISTGYTKHSSSATSAINSDGTFTNQYSLTIDASADLTIQEIGIYIAVPYFPSSSSSSTATFGYNALINRIVLDEPVSVAANQTATIRFSITTPKITLS